MRTNLAARELLNRAQARTPQMIALIRRLVEQESPSFQKPAVDELGRLLAREFEQRGARVKFHPAKKFGDHLQADFAGSGKPIMLLGHFDTVYDLGTLSSMPWGEQAGRLMGPGVLDMKTGIAQMLFAVDLLRDMHGALPRPVTALLVTDEEVGSESSRAITESLATRSAAVLVCEPSYGPKGSLKTARKGVGDYTIRVTGVASHAGLDPFQGQSAIVELARQIEKIDGFTEKKRGLTVNPGIVRGGTRTNVIAAQAECEVDVRIERLADAARIEKKFRGLKPFNRRCKVEVSGGINRPPMERSPGVAKLFALAQQAGREMGTRLGEAAVGGGSDGNFTTALGIPTLDGLGAVGEGAHAPHESVAIDEIPRRTALLARLLELI